MNAAQDRKTLVRNVSRFSSWRFRIFAVIVFCGYAVFLEGRSSGVVYFQTMSVIGVVLLIMLFVLPPIARRHQARKPH